MKRMIGILGVVILFNHGDFFYVKEVKGTIAALTIGATGSVIEGVTQRNNNK